MDRIQQNIKWLRKQQDMTQEQFANELKIKRSKLGAYEEGRARPNYELLQSMSRKFGFTVDQLISKDVSRVKPDEENSQGKLKVLSITVDREGKENIELVPVKARAGYLTGYADPGYLEELPRFSLPFLPHGTFRAFEIMGDSMLPLLPGSVVVGEYIDDWRQVKDGQSCIVVSEQDGIVYKRIFKDEERDMLILRSDNIDYPAYSLKLEDVNELWRGSMHIQPANRGDEHSYRDLLGMMQQLKDKVDKLERN